MQGSDLVSWLHGTEHLSDVLRRLRAAQELTLQEVADYAGMAKSYISMIERGQMSPERDTLIALLLAALVCLSRLQTECSCLRDMRRSIIVR
jgi:transcriptional regulator with XRE-family HTH domain